MKMFLEKKIQKFERNPQKKTLILVVIFCRHLLLCAEKSVQRMHDHLFFLFFRAHSSSNENTAFL